MKQRSRFWKIGQSVTRYSSQLGYGISLLLALWLAVATMVHLDYKQAVDEIEHNNEQLVRAFEAHVRSSFMVVDQQLLLMDEPFVSLDTPTANRLREMLVEQWQRCGASVLFVTHDLREALALADRVCFLSAAPGRVVLDLPVDLPRPRDAASPAVDRLYQALLARHPELETIAFNGGAAETLFRRHVAQACGDLLEGVELARLPSTSPAHAARSFAQKLGAWQNALGRYG